MPITEDLLDRALVELDAVELLRDADRGADPLVAQALHQKAVALLDEVSQVDAATLDDTDRQRLVEVEAALLRGEDDLEAEFGQKVEPRLRGRAYFVTPDVIPAFAIGNTKKHANARNSNVTAICEVRGFPRLPSRYNQPACARLVYFGLRV